MIQRSLQVLAALAGLAVLAGLVVVGIDALQAARTGPRWRRRLIAAALVLLSALGLSTAQETQAQSTPPPPAAGPAAPAAAPASQPAQELTKTQQWLTIVDTWQFVAPLASSHQSSRAQRGEVTRRIAAATKAVKELRDTGLLDPTEATLLLVDLTDFATDVTRDPPIDSTVDCYDMAQVIPAQRSFLRLDRRLVPLAELARSGKLRPEAVAKVLPAIDADIQVLSNPKELAKLSKEDQAKAKEVQANVTKALEQIRAKLPSSTPTTAPATKPAPTAATAPAKDELTQSRQWVAVVEAWYVTDALLQNKEATATQCTAADDKLDLAEISITRLAQRRLLTPSEAALLATEIVKFRGQVSTLREVIDRKNTPPALRPMCYAPVANVNGPSDCMARLRKRLPLLAKLARSGKLHPEAVNKVLRSIQDDIDALERTGADKELSVSHREEAPKLCAKIREVLTQIQNVQSKTKERP